MADKGLLVVVSAASGTGKTTLCKLVKERGQSIAISVSHTTRLPRGEEQDGNDYYFVTEEEFSRMVDAGEFAEWAAVHGHRYGTAHRTIEKDRAAGKNVLLSIDVQGGLQLRARYDEAVLVFLLPPSAQELLRRLRSRHTDNVEVIGTRMRNALTELEVAKSYDYLVVNDDLEQAAREALAIIQAEKLKTLRNFELAQRVREELLSYLRGDGAGWVAIEETEGKQEK